MSDFTKALGKGKKYVETKVLAPVEKNVVAPIVKQVKAAPKKVGKSISDNAGGLNGYFKRVTWGVL